MLRFIVANTGAGKTSYVCARFGIERMHGDPARKAVQYAKNITEKLNANGFTLSPPQTKHLVYAYNVNIKIRSPDFGTRQSLHLDATRLGFNADKFTPQFVYPGSTLIIDEMQTVFDSRNWQEYSVLQSRYFEQCRKINLDVIFIAQNANLGELRIRQLCEITFIHNLRIVEDLHGNITRCVWLVEIWDRLDDYLNGKRGRREKYVFPGNIFKYFDTNEGSERFFDGLQNSDFEAIENEAPTMSPTGIAEYVRENPIIRKGAKHEQKH